MKVVVINSCWDLYGTLMQVLLVIFSEGCML